MSWIILDKPIEVPKSSAAINDNDKFWSAIVDELTGHGDEFDLVLGEPSKFCGKRTVLNPSNFQFVKHSLNEVDVSFQFEYQYEDIDTGTVLAKYKADWTCKIDPQKKRLTAGTLLTIERV